MEMKMLIKKVLCCLIISVIVTSGVPSPVLASNSNALPLGMYIPVRGGDNEPLKQQNLVEVLKQHGVDRIFVAGYHPTGDGKGVLQITKKRKWQGTTDDPEFKGAYDLDSLIAEAHNENIEVHVIVCCFGGSGVPSESVNAMSYIHQTHLKEVIKYLLHNFKELDGIHLDYIRFMSEHGYMAEGDTDTIANFIWQCSEIKEGGIPVFLVKDLSAAVFAAYNENSYKYVWRDVGQDYNKMSQYLDFICPMAYHYPDHDASWVGDVTKFVKQKVTEKCLVIPDIQTFPNENGAEPGYEDVRKAISSALGNGADGINIFVYDWTSGEDWRAIDDFFHPSESPEFTPLDLCMVLDRSGSMDESMGDKTRMQGVKEAATGVVNVLLPQDRVSIVPFSDTATANIDFTSDFSRVKTKIDAIKAEGNTSFGAGLKAALDQFKDHGNPDHNPAILFMSDGEHKGIPIFTVGFATSESEVDVTKLKMMAEETGGGYHFVSKIFDLQNIFLRLEHKTSGWESVAAYVGEVDELFDPSSRQVDFSASNVIYSGDTKPEYVIIKDPQSGYWTTKVYGKSIGSSEAYYVLVTKYVPPMVSPVHNVNTGEDFATIQNAIDDPYTQDGHTVTVDPGTYTEHLAIDKPLKLMGDDKNTTIIEGIGSGNPYCVHVTADNVEISGFTIQHGMYGILLESSDSCTISENIIHDSNDGIHLTDSNNNVIINNILFNNIWELGPNGIILSSSDNNVITDNELVENGDGVSLHESKNNLIYHNNFVDSIFNQAYDSTGTNSWDNGPTEGGNYWSDHGCVGNPSAGSQPYYINTDGVDHYPFQDPNGWLNGVPDGNTFTNTIGMEFVPIPVGEFDMGSPSDEEDRWSAEGPVHHVNIGKAFYMGRYEVTQQQWRAIMGDNPSRFTGDDLPVEQVSWYDLQEFIKKLNEKEGTDKYRLPSEAEWEYACRTGTTTRYSFGGDESNLGEYAWYDDNSGDKTHPIGQKQPNSWGLYDMHGNVWEWVQDSWHSNYNGAPTDGSAWESGDGTFRVFRGGGWSFLAANCRSAIRFFIDPGGRSSYLGFRLLREQ
jgi:parallel beta-helix repeat protein